MRRHLVMMALLATVACSRLERGDNPSRTIGPRPVEASTASRERRIVVAEDAACKSSSAADKISLSLSGAKLEDALALLGMMAGSTIRTEGVDVAGVLSDAHLEDYPWDCAVDGVARALGLERSSGGAEILLVPKQ